MPSESFDRGREFEDEIREPLLALQAKHPKRVRVADHPRIKLYDGREVIPDFVLEYDMLDGRHGITIECQSRQRSQTDIVDKIRTMKALSSSNRFLFVYRDQLPEATANALKADGTKYLSYAEFVIYIEHLITSNIDDTDDRFKKGCE